MKSIASCSWDTCPVAASPYGYPPSAAASGIFVVIYAGSLIACFLYTIYTRRWLEFSIPVSTACLFEIIGHGVRLGSAVDPWDVRLYAASTTFLLIAPVFVSVGIYFTISKTVTILGEEHSLINVAHYPRLIWIDVLGFIFQIIGIAISFSDLSPDERLGPKAKIGSPIIAVGVVLQALSLIYFLVLFGYVLFQAAVHYRQFGYTTFHPRHGFVPMASRFKVYIVILLVSVVCLLGRDLYQAIVLSLGLDSWAEKNQALFAGLDGLLVAESVVGLVVAHPVGFLEDGVRKKLRRTNNPLIEQGGRQHSRGDSAVGQGTVPWNSTTNFI
ncbi:RTA1 like protein-domain-containing protein [Xylariaceae sp. FL0662B]|nr:RTA1 like protein-domain-containing protein [Xylariaceae sp. FL0662B]